MVTFQVELTEEVADRAKVYAEQLHKPIEQALAEVVEQKFAEPPKRKSTIGLFADDPEIMDEVMELIRADRENAIPLREFTLE